MEAAEQQAAEPETPLHEGPPIEELIAQEEEPEPPAAEEAAPDAAPEPDWRADADAALRQQ